jgi:hypothetical protein
MVALMVAENAMFCWMEQVSVEAVIIYKEANTPYPWPKLGEHPD